VRGEGLAATQAVELAERTPAGPPRARRRAASGRAAGTGGTTRAPVRGSRLCSAPSGVRAIEEVRAALREASEEVCTPVFSKRGMASYEVDDRERQVFNQEQALLFKVTDRIGDLNLDGVDEYSVASNGKAPIH